MYNYPLLGLQAIGSFPYPVPQFSGRILFAAPDASAIFLHNDLLCNGTCSVTGGAKRTGGTNGKDPGYLITKLGGGETSNGKGPQYLSKTSNNLIHSLDNLRHQNNLWIFSVREFTY